MNKTISFLIIFILFLTPVFAMAETNNSGSIPKATIVPQQGTQASAARSGGTSSSGSSGSISGAVTGAASCAVGSAVANLVKNQISGIVNGISSPTEVPVNETQQRAKDVGIAGSLSWDGLGYCMVNAIIEYIGTATVQWINSGFKGNPVFVENPEQFFANIADIEAGNFLNDISGGYLCSPIQTPVKINLARNYNNKVSPYSQRARCTFSGTSGSMEQFLSGQSFSWDDWSSYIGNPYNNSFGATIYGQIELDNRIASALGTESTLLEWGRGFFSPRDENGKITSPGSLIENRLNDRLGSGERRIEMADEFDEIVSALVNQLIKIALSEIGGSGKGNSGNDSSYRGNRQFDYSGQNTNTQTTGQDAPQGQTALMCRNDIFAPNDYEYDGTCFPSKWMEYEYSYSFQIPDRAALCELPEGVDAESDSAKSYYNGVCIPPTQTNTDFLTAHQLLQY